MADSPAGSFFVPHDLDAPIPGAAKGPLAGLTAAIKDMYDIAGTRTGGGNPEWLAAQKPAARHAGAVAQILDAGATIVGKTICDEFFYSVTGANAHYGTPVNVRAPGRLPGGSSSGSAAATAAGACDFALGSDTGGSIRVPASFCGLYGCGRRTGEWISPAPWACRRRSTSPDGSRPAPVYFAMSAASCCRVKATTPLSAGW
jgi:amidase